jgi:hypothetical protein
MFGGGNLITTMAWPRQERLDAGTCATMVILPFPGSDGAFARPIERAAWCRADNAARNFPTHNDHE